MGQVAALEAEVNVWQVCMAQGWANFAIAKTGKEIHAQGPTAGRTGLTLW